MFVEYSRPMNDAERAVVQGHLDAGPFITFAHTLKWVAIWIVALLACSAGAYGLARWRPNAIVVDTLASIVVAAVVVSLFAIAALVRSYVHWRGVDRRFDRTTRPDLEAALGRGDVSVKKVVASAVVVIVPIEIDEGTGYLYDIGEGKLLFLAGQQYFPIREEEDSLWPTDAFEVVRMSQGDYWIGIFCSGQLLEPRRVVPASEWREDFVFEHCEDVIEAKLDEYVASRIAKPPGSAG